ncbi:unnamed protein product [Brassica napus]|uniref:(rape) hypothetical protein n=1 Tax=Brassica napus TaxID=3708 RepID=A0A816YDS9_BRANA|nr:unnamed protein product [Brassica napus]CAF2370366.1 unnamed protein product [Brassica napus]
MNLPEKMRSLVEAYKRQKIEELMKNNDDLAEEIEMEEGNGKKWWNIPDESLSVEELKRKHQGLLSYIIAYEIRLYNGREKNGDGSSSCPARHGHCGGSKAELSV